MTAPIREEITLISKFKPRQGMEQRLFDELQSVAAAGRQEAGNRLYILHRSRDETDGTILLYVIWANQAAWDFHVQTKPFLNFIAMSDEILIEPLEYNIWSEVSR
jgi:quinol monooxygenase YgiN